MDESLSQLQRVAIAPSQLQHSTLTLTPEQQHYLRRVLRLQQGDRFIAMDGQGCWWLAMVDQATTAVVLEAIAIATELPIPMTLLVAMPKGNGMDDIVRQTTELGVAEIWPVMSDRTLLQPSATKVERWRRIAREAAEQSERQFIPTILEPTPWVQALEPVAQAVVETGAIAYLCTARGNPRSLLTDWQQHRPTPPSRIFVATGPEGGWSLAEQEGAIAHHFSPVSLGQRILRAVTAPGVAIALLAAVQEAPPSAKQP